MKKILAYYDRLNFVDPKTQSVMIVCESKFECRPAKTLKAIRNDGADLMYNYEVTEWNLKQSQNEMIYEEEEYNGEMFIDKDDWVRAVEDNFKLKVIELTKYNTRVLYEDNSWGEIRSDKLWIEM